MRKKILFSSLIILLLLYITIPVSMSKITYKETEDGLVYYIENNNVYICGYEGTSRELIIPEQIENYPVISVGGFYEDVGIKKITLPDSIIEIRESAFEGCSNLKNINIPTNIVNIYSSAFKGCSSLEKIMIPTKVNKIWKETFYGCSSLNEIMINDGVEVIDEMCFSNCSSLEKIELPPTIYEIGSQSFCGCSTLKEIDLSQTKITEINDNLFGGCDNLTYVKLPESVKEIGMDSFSDCENLLAIKIPKNVKRIGQWAFKNCSSLRAVCICGDGTLIADDSFNEAKDGLVIYGNDDSVAHEYAEANNIEFKNKSEFGVYKIVFENYDETILKEEYIIKGDNVIKPEIPSREGYVFDGWDKDINTISGDTVVKAKYRSPEMVGVTFKDYDGTVLKEEQVLELENVNPPEEPHREGYRFIGWDKEFSCIINDTIITATYAKLYKVTFKDYDGNILKIVETTDGNDVEPPNNPYRLGYYFKGWDTDYKIINQDTIVTAVYKIDSATLIAGKRKYNSIKRTYKYDSDSMEYGSGIWRIDDPQIARVVSWDKTIIGMSIYEVTYSIKIEGKKCGSTYLRMYSETGKILDTRVLSVLPTQINLSDCRTKNITEVYEYKGKEIEPHIDIFTSEGIMLIENEDYIVKYKDNKEIGKAIIEIEGLNPFEGTIKEEFIISPAKISKLKQTIDLSNKIYNGQEQKISIKLMNGDIELIENQDYIVNYINNINAGVATINIEGIGNYQGTINKEFTIEKENMEITYEISNTISTYDNKYHNICISNVNYDDAIVKYKDQNGEYTLDEVPKYKNAGEYDIGYRIYVDENHTDIREIQKMTIKPKDISLSEKINIDDNDKTYTGREIIPDINIEDLGLLLEYTKDYVIDVENNINVGTTELRINGIGNYCGNIKTNINIIPLDINLLEISIDKNNKTYTGNNLKTKVKLSSNKVLLQEGKDYKVKYYNNKNIGKATVEILGIGNYSGNIIGTFCIVPKGTSITKLTSGKKSFTVKWNKQTTQTSGYEIMYSTSSKFKSGNKTVKIKSNKITSKKISKLKAKKKYYVKIRTYKTVNGKKFYSGWSKVKTVTIKK